MDDSARITENELWQATYGPPADTAYAIGETLTWLDPDGLQTGTILYIGQDEETLDDTGQPERICFAVSVGSVGFPRPVWRSQVEAVTPDL